MATCALTGDLLQPSYPLTPLDQQLTNYSNGDPPTFSLWGSYTAVPSNFTHVNLWFLGFVFGGGIKHQNDPEKTGGATVSLTQADLAPRGPHLTSHPDSSLLRPPAGASESQHLPCGLFEYIHKAICVKGT